MDNWQTYVDADKRFTLFYPSAWTIKGKENFLSSIDLTSTNPNSSSSRITIAYSMNDSSLNYTGDEIIVPQNNLRKLEEQMKAAYQTYEVVGKGSPAYTDLLLQVILLITQNITERRVAC